MVTEIKSYQCDICETAYDTIEEAIECESKGIVQAKRSIGETLQIIPRYPENGQKFVECKIVGVRVADPVLEPHRPPNFARHRFGYALDRRVQIGRSLWVGDVWGLLYEEDLEWCEYHPNDPDQELDN